MPENTPSSRSSNPANQPTIKQQRAAAREKKLEDYRKREARSKRNKKLGIIGGVVAGVAVVGLVVTTVVLTPKPVSYDVDATNSIADLQTFENGAGHTTDDVTYAQTPPAGGEHNPYWLNCGVYSEPQTDENAVHSLEHGAVWVTYNPDISDADLDAIKAKLPSTYVILSPFPGLENTLTLSAWNAQLTLDSVDDERFEKFFENYWRSSKVPEPGASCVGAVDGPGKE